MQELLELIKAFDITEIGEMSPGRLMFYGGLGLFGVTIILLIIFLIWRPKYVPENAAVHGPGGKPQQQRYHGTTDHLAAKQRMSGVSDSEREPLAQTTPIDKTAQGKGGSQAGAELPTAPIEGTASPTGPMGQSASPTGPLYSPGGETAPLEGGRAGATVPLYQGTPGLTQPVNQGQATVPLAGGYERTGATIPLSYGADSTVPLYFEGAGETAVHAKDSIPQGKEQERKGERK